MPPSRAWTTRLFGRSEHCPVDGGEVAEDGRTLSFAPATTSGFEVVGTGWVSALPPAPSIVLGREQTRTHDTLANERAVRGHSRGGIEGLSGLLFRERRSVQQGGEERIEIAGAGELIG